MEKVNELQLPFNRGLNEEETKACRTSAVKTFFRKFWLPTLMLVPAGVCFLFIQRCTRFI